MRQRTEVREAAFLRLTSCRLPHTSLQWNCPARSLIPSSHTRDAACRLRLTSGLRFCGNSAALFASFRDQAFQESCCLRNQTHEGKRAQDIKEHVCVRDLPAHVVAAKGRPLTGSGELMGEGEAYGDRYQIEEEMKNRCGWLACRKLTGVISGHGVRSKTVKPFSSTSV